MRRRNIEYSVNWVVHFLAIVAHKDLQIRIINYAIAPGHGPYITRRFILAPVFDELLKVFYVHKTTAVKIHQRDD